MNKALEFLKKSQGFFKELVDSYSESGDYDGDYDYESAVETLNDIQEAIAELEEAMKPKSCSTCEHLMDRLRICHKKVQLHDGSLPNNFYCSRYEPKG